MLERSNRSPEHDELEQASATEDELGQIAASEDADLASGPLVARCVQVDHPELRGRVRIEISGGTGAKVERWVPTLQGVAVREGDHVLLAKPRNWAEPIVVGVVDGFARRPAVPKTPAGRLTLQTDECLRVDAQGGEPLVELYHGPDGPVARLLADDLDLELAGELRVSARSIALTAREGETRIAATADVVVNGETIQLN